jgi:antitoxin VapB
MSLNVKHPDAHRLARELAALTGETLTDAVTVALRERLMRERAARRAGPGLAERLVSIGADCARRLEEPYATGDPGELLHGDDGLPR